MVSANGHPSSCRTRHICHVDQRRARGLPGLLNDAKTPVCLQHHGLDFLERTNAYRAHSGPNFGFRDPLRLHNLGHKLTSAEQERRDQGVLRQEQEDQLPAQGHVQGRFVRDGRPEAEVQAEELTL